MKKKVVVLGATGSIGKNTVRVLETLRDRFETVGLAARRDAAGLADAAARLHCRDLVVADPAALAELERLAPSGCRCRAGMDALTALAAESSCDTVVCAIVGTGGLLPVLSALRAGKRIALASKEVMVMAGELVTAELDAEHGEIIPVDSEHSALFQCLNGRAASEVRRLILTASGGAFRDFTREQLQTARCREALNHPVWSMGDKVTIDSATLMNKALEIIEARFLFRMGPEKIDVVIHPESLVHSMVELVDGALIAQMSVPDMRFAIQYALTWPLRCDGVLPRLDWGGGAKLNFRAPDRTLFPSLDFAYEALRAGGTMPAVLNAANEVAVEAFQLDRITVPELWRTVDTVMTRHNAVPQNDLQTVLEADAWARAAARGFLHLENQQAKG